MKKYVANNKDRLPAGLRLKHNVPQQDRAKNKRTYDKLVEAQGEAITSGLQENELRISGNKLLKCEKDGTFALLCSVVDEA
eukprot:3378779-Karenia_brevis.AAC.1